MGQNLATRAQPWIVACVLALGQVAAAAAADQDFLEPSLLDLPDEPCCVSNWYLKGFIGITDYAVDDIHSDVFKTSKVEVLNQAFDGSGFGGLGLGYAWSSWLRFDVTSEYRNRSTFHALDRYSGPGISGANDYTATLKSWVTLANAYWDIFRWKGITPYVGGGIGYARNWIGDYREVNVPNLGVAYGKTTEAGNFAFAIHAGLSYDVTPNFTVDLAYRYLNIGDGNAGKASVYDRGNVVDALSFDDTHSNDIMLAARWKFGCCGGTPEPETISFK